MTATDERPVSAKPPDVSDSPTASARMRDALRATASLDEAISAKLVALFDELNEQGEKRNRKALQRIRALEAKVDAQAAVANKAQKSLSDLLLSLKKVLDAADFAHGDSFSMHVLDDERYWFSDTLSSTTTASLVHELLGANSRSAPKDAHAYNIAGIECGAGDVVLDIGANIGVFSVLVAKRFPGVKVIAFEPSARNCENLRKNVVANGVADRVLVEHLAVTGDGREVELVFMPGKPRDAFLSDMAGQMALSETKKRVIGGSHLIEREVVASLSLDAIFAKHQIDRLKLLKIDCEGAEDEILRQTTVLPRIDHICGELHYGERRDRELVGYLSQFVDREHLRFGKPGQPSAYVS